VSDDSNLSRLVLTPFYPTAKSAETTKVSGDQLMAASDPPTPLKPE